MDITNLLQEDNELAKCLALEQQRQRDNLEMIASESIQPPAVLQLSACAFSNKTAVGLPGKQRLMGSQYADMLERLASDRACEVFGAEHANMLPYSGSAANYCAYWACLNPHDRVVAMDSLAGAHQSHGGMNNMSSKIYDFSYFGLDPNTFCLDYDKAQLLAEQIQPKLMVVGSASYSKNIDYEKLAYIAHSNGALLMTDIAHFSGLIAAGVSPNPVQFADIVTASSTKTMCGPHSGFIMCKKALAHAVDKSIYPGNIASVHLQTIAAVAYALKYSQKDEFRQLMKQVVSNAKHLCHALQKNGFGIVSGGTDCHMFVADLRPFKADCEKTAAVFQDIGIAVNTKAIPYDTQEKPGGIRAGTTVLTQRGMKEREMEIIADIWLEIVRSPDNIHVIKSAKNKVLNILKEFPIKE